MLEELKKGFRQQQTQQVIDSRPALAKPFVFKDAGFCPATTCPSGDSTIRLAWQHDPTIPDHIEASKEGAWAVVKVPSPHEPFSMLTRNRNTDTLISALIQDGKVFDVPVRQILLDSLLRSKNKDKSSEPPIFIDIGANIGYFSSTALAVGARVISFEPFFGNAGSFMSTVRKNKWQDRSTLYMNAVSYESVRVTMKSTNDKINLSNMHITSSNCVTNETAQATGTYGIDYMDAVSLDQVMFERHADIEHVDLIKIDVETHEVQVFNGAMYFLCNRRVDRIIVEVEYLKSVHGLGKCKFPDLQDRLERMGFSMFDSTMKINRTGMSFENFPSADAVFSQNFPNESPANRLRGTFDNPCADFDLGSTTSSSQQG